MNPVSAFIRLIRLPNLLIIVATQYAIRYAIIGPFLFKFSGDQDIHNVGLKMSDLNFFLLCLSTVMIAAAGYIINDYFDVKVDRVNRPETILVGKHIKRRVAMGAHIVISGIAILIGAYLAYEMQNWKLGLIQVFSVGALWYYSTLFKKQVLVGNIVVALLAALVPFVVGLYELLLQKEYVTDTVNALLFYLEEGTPFELIEYQFMLVLTSILYWTLGFSLFAFLSTMVREIIKDAEDYEGDKKYFSNTLSVIYGTRKGALVAQLFAVLMILALGYVQYNQLISKDTGSFMYFLFAIQVPLIYVIYKLNQAKEKADFTKLSKYMKLIMLMGILYSLFFYLNTINV
ncbi:MAG: geranylgeranylglycerol-phosphate geranylgeranyltransferase [Flavobacteriales bacterium]|nr:geranylgeranylglycerol-phosphate geranylgeranyltransferase [Flavobacteriales bacterium]